MSDFDTTNVTASGIQDGQHICDIVSAEMRTTKSGEGKYLNLKWQVVGGSSFYQMYNTVNPNKTAENIGLGDIARIQAACGMAKGTGSASDFVGKRLLVTIKNKSDNYGDKAVAVKYAAAPADSGDIPF
jgi:hypothetical protein